jgi:hypothetical protein
VFPQHITHYSTASVTVQVNELFPRARKLKYELQQQLEQACPFFDRGLGGRRERTTANWVVLI